ncbi:MAG: metallophosphoesterase family protein [Planctomycetota bacterium]|jgi:diadenosine tetraphosphatase ApaH/serine/threonine PP2A family protein phosphatase|nr:metallophosphoesterase family protein [Planctomycetota bacterium]
MKYGILGDVHANLSALRAVLERFDREGVEHIISVGDVVGYGAAPAECVALLRERGATVVKGNHDAASTGELEVLYFNPYARAAVAWTRANLGGDEIDWLKALPLVAELEHCCVGHGTFHRPELFDYILSSTDGDPSLDTMERAVCFVGHTHVPLALLRLHEDPLRTSTHFDHEEIDVGQAHRTLINVGSVGQPRDDDPRAAYALFDSELGRVWIQRAAYDIEREAARIRAAGLPEVLADRLSLGV